MPLGEFLEFMHSKFQGEDELEEEKNRTLWSLVFRVGDEQLHRSDQDAGKAGFASTRELGKEYL